MKVVFFTYPSAFQNIGGGEIQLLKTREYLEKHGLQIDLFDLWRTKIEAYDILHVFSSVKECLPLIQVARSRNVKVVTNSGLWSDFHRAVFTDGGWGRKTDLLLRHGLKVACPVFPSSRRQVLLSSDLVCPNSEMEKNQIARLFAVPRRKIKVVYNGVDKSFLEADPSYYHSLYGKAPFVLSVGRIEPRKNQLNLIKAVKRLGDARLVLIGDPVSGHEKYFRECQSAGSGFTKFLPAVGHSDPLLKSAYGACDLFVLQGWFETPGLAAMEAALAGTKVLVTEGGSTKEYFKNFVDYIRPSSTKDITDKIKKNLAKKREETLKNHVLMHFTWDTVTRNLLDYYRGLKEAA